MPEFLKYPFGGSAIPGLTIVGARFTTSTAGAISGTPEVAGCSIAKTAAKTGRYTITLARPSGRIFGALVTIVGPDDAALTTTKGLDAVVRDDDIASDGTIEVQLVQTNAGNADTEVQDGASVRILLFLSDTTLTA